MRCATQTSVELVPAGIRFLYSFDARMKSSMVRYSHYLAIRGRNMMDSSGSVSRAEYAHVWSLAQVWTTQWAPNCEHCQVRLGLAPPDSQRRVSHCALTQFQGLMRCCYLHLRRRSAPHPHGRLLWYQLRDGIFSMHPRQSEKGELSGNLEYA